MNLTNALAQFRGERKRAQEQVEKFDAVIRGIESLIGRNGSEATSGMTQPKHPVSVASRRKMALAQKARWAKVRKESQPAPVVKKTSTAPVKRTMSAAARRKIAAFQRARWARVKAAQKKAA